MSVRRWQCADRHYARTLSILRRLSRGKFGYVVQFVAYARTIHPRPTSAFRVWCCRPAAGEVVWAIQGIVPVLVGFKDVQVEGDGVRLHCLIGGDGPPLVLLHGYPQTLGTWSKVAPALASHFKCFLFDLRGYGRSEAPLCPDPDGKKYSKRAMALDIVMAMRALGYDTFSLVGHDRGARVAYRLASNHPEVVRRLAIIEVIPTDDMWANFDAEMALKAYHWTFLAQPSPLPENLIAADPIAYVDWTLRSWTKSGTLECFLPEPLEQYRAQFREPRRIAAFCADYRAGASIDRAHDIQDTSAGRKITAPMCFLYASDGFPAKAGDPLRFWRSRAEDVKGFEIPDVGHFAQEEQPDLVAQRLLLFFQN